MGIEWSEVSWKKCTWWVCVSRREKFLFSWALNPTLTAGNLAHSSDKSLRELEPTSSLHGVMQSHQGDQQGLWLGKLTEKSPAWRPRGTVSFLISICLF